MKFRKKLLSLAFLSLFIVSLGCPKAMGNCLSNEQLSVVENYVPPQVIPVTVEQLPPINFNGITVTDKEVNCLAQAMYFEARGQGTKGMTAVASVVLNRKNVSDYPSTLCEVVYQPGQFSWTSNRKINRVPREKFVWDNTKLLANNIILSYNDNTFKDITNGAIYFDSANIKRRKHFVKTAKIGTHNFYKVSYNGKFGNSKKKIGV